MPESHPFVISKIVPENIIIKNSTFADVKVLLRYSYKPTNDPPQKVKVTMMPPNNQYAGRKGFVGHAIDTKGLSIEEIRKRLLDRERNRVDPMRDPHLYSIGKMVSYPHTREVELTAEGETKEVVMRITIPLDYPEEFFGRGVHINCAFKVDSYKVMGMAAGMEVTVEK
jgi:hypothetical protein